MLMWEDVKNGIESFSDVEKEAIDFSVDLVSVIIERRMELGFTQKQLADMSGVKQPAIARIESFRVKPQLETIYKLIKPLKLKLQLLPYI